MSTIEGNTQSSTSVRVQTPTTPTRPKYEGLGMVAGYPTRSVGTMYDEKGKPIDETIKFANTSKLAHIDKTKNKNKK